MHIFYKITGLISVAISLYIGAAAGPIVVIDTIKNGKREPSLTTSTLGISRGCKNRLTGVLFGCWQDSTAGYSGMHVVDIAPPQGGESGPEKKVLWRIPDVSDPRRCDSHIRSNHGIIYLGRTESHVVLTLERRGKLTKINESIFTIPQDVATVYLLLEIATKGDFSISRMFIDDRPPATVVAYHRQP